jgi:ABC-type Mn2+/Zn2+ transport system permease subunit
VPVPIAPGGHVHVQEMLAGSLLWTTWSNIACSLGLFSVISLAFLAFRKPFNRLSDNYDKAVADGMNAAWWDFLFYVLLGVVITVAVRMAGIVTVFALLIIPATISVLFSSSWTGRLIIAWVASAVAAMAGHLFAYSLDFSVGPAVVLFLGIELVVAAIIGRFVLMNFIISGKVEEI